MNTILPRHLAALFVLCFAVLCIGADTSGCGDPQSTTKPLVPCCPDGTTTYLCTLSVAIQDIALMGEGNPPKTDYRCYDASPVCATDLTQAQSKATAQAQLYYQKVDRQAPVVQSIGCGIITLNACTDATKPQDFYEPLDMPGACSGVTPVPDAGAPTPDAGPVNDCLDMPQSDACETCIYSSCCPAYDACVLGIGGLQCTSEVGYWQGINPQTADASTTPEIVALDQCVASHCDGYCTHYHHGPHTGAAEPVRFDTRAP